MATRKGRSKLTRIGVAGVAFLPDLASMTPARIIERLPTVCPDSGHVFVHVLHDSALMQSAAAMTCDQLRAALSEDLEVHVLWSHFQHLADEHYSREAAEVAAQSDVVILATTCQQALPGCVARWLGSWICQHHKPDTAFCGLFLGRVEGNPPLPPVASLLEATAKLTGREWLAGCVRRPTEQAVSRSITTHSVVESRSLFYAPACHGING